MTRNLLDCLIDEDYPRFFQDQNDVYYLVEGNGENEKSIRMVPRRISIVSWSNYMPNRNGTMWSRRVLFQAAKGLYEYLQSIKWSNTSGIKGGLSNKKAESESAHCMTAIKKDWNLQMKMVIC